MSRIVVFFPVFACILAFQACSSSSSKMSPQQIAAYAVATGFLTLCDDGNYRNALIFRGTNKVTPGRRNVDYKDAKQTRAFRDPDFALLD